MALQRQYNLRKVNCILNRKLGVWVVDPHVVTEIPVAVDVLDVWGYIAQIKSMQPFPVIICVRDTVGYEIIIALTVLHIVAAGQ